MIIEGEEKTAKFSKNSTTMQQLTSQADRYSLNQPLQEYNASPNSTPCSHAYNSNESSHTEIYPQYDQFSQLEQNQFTDLQPIYQHQIPLINTGIHNVITPCDNASEIGFGPIEISAGYYPNPKNNNYNQTECNAMPQFSVGRLEKNENEMRLNSSRKYPNKFARNTIDRSDNKNVRSFWFATTNNGENLFLNTYPFTRVETNNEGLSYLHIDMAEYNELRGEELKEFNKKCEDTFSQIDLDSEGKSVKSERLRFQKRNCKEKNKHNWDSCNKRYYKSRKTATKAVSVSEYDNSLPPHTPDISSQSSSSSQEVQESVTPETPVELSLLPFSQSTPSPINHIIKDKSEEEYLGWVTPEEEEDNYLSMFGNFSTIIVFI